MTNKQDAIQQLIKRQNDLSSKQEKLSMEIHDLRNKIKELQQNENQGTDENKIAAGQTQLLQSKSKSKSIPVDSSHFDTQQLIADKPKKVQKSTKSDWERFIGENLINKIGIAITIIGVGIGTKYSIDNELITPLTRIILGYLTGLILLFVGIRLKPKYESYSAVLVSGAITIMYFLTYLGYSFYDLFPQTLAFVLMLIFTVFTVFAAFNYNRQVIAHIALVGAYAVPFLLSDDSGKVGVLFTYMTIINLGILFIAFKKYWKELHYTSFFFTWLIFFSWFVTKFEVNEHVMLASVFLIVFFALFYLLFLAYKLIRKESFNRSNSLLLLSNSFIFYGIGYALLLRLEQGTSYLGLFTLGNAIVHSIVSLIIYKQKLADKNIFYLISGLVLIFTSITFPVQLDGNWVTLLWACEAVLLFWIGRNKKVVIYEALSFPLMILAFFSILHDWALVYNSYDATDPSTRMTLFLNVNFMSSVLCSVAFFLINRLNSNPQNPSLLASWIKTTKILSYLIPGILIFTAYFSIRLEISNYWHQLLTDSVINIQPDGENYTKYFKNTDLFFFKGIWIINYSLLFFALLAILNIKKIKNKKITYLSFGLAATTIFIFLSQGLYSFSELRESYLSQELSEYYHRNQFNLIIRYVSIIFAGISLSAIYFQVKKQLNTKLYFIAFDALLFISLVWVLSSELINWMSITGASQLYKLGLSILWGSYSLLLIIYGIWKHKKHLRIGAISLFALTLVKLFFYDISQLSTISKTIVFVSLGILLLIISFLYNKYKSNILEEANGEIN
ncbi:DUF2339 domain-containing protein [Labilibaculum sp.]|uniref:DUF2339 domain-containing protein n=1 Tax=Labilibaculum sp. TaxID=2060723 RepID=UPI003562A461